MFPQHWYYFTKVLIPYARADEMPPETFIYHSLPAAFGFAGLCAWVFLWLILTWGFVSSTVFARDPKAGRQKSFFCFVLLAAWMVFAAKTSYDYNLILMIPLFALLTVGGFGDRRRAVFFGALLALLGFALPRWAEDVFLPGLYPVSAYLIFLNLGLGLLGFCAAFVSLEKKGGAA
jgi:hypothetical protein